MTDRLDDGLPRELRTVTLTTDETMAVRYAELTADFNPIHLDAAFAAATPFGSPIIHGTMGLNLLMLAVEESFRGAMPAADIEARFIRPVPVGTTIRAGGTLVDAATGTYELFVETEGGLRAVEGTLSLRACKK